MVIIIITKHSKNATTVTDPGIRIRFVNKLRRAGVGTSDAEGCDGRYGQEKKETDHTVHNPGKPEGEALAEITRQQFHFLTPFKDRTIRQAFRDASDSKIISPWGVKVKHKSKKHHSPFTNPCFYVIIAGAISETPCSGGS